MWAVWWVTFDQSIHTLHAFKKRGPWFPGVKPWLLAAGVLRDLPAHALAQRQYFARMDDGLGNLLHRAAPAHGLGADHVVGLVFVDLVGLHEDGLGFGHAALAQQLGLELGDALLLLA